MSSASMETMTQTEADALDAAMILLADALEGIA